MQQPSDRRCQLREVREQGFFFDLRRRNDSLTSEQKNKTKNSCGASCPASTANTNIACCSGVCEDLNSDVNVSEKEEEKKVLPFSPTRTTLSLLSTSPFSLFPKTSLKTTHRTAAHAVRYVFLEQEVE